MKDVLGKLRWFPFYRVKGREEKKLEQPTSQFETGAKKRTCRKTETV